jgi:hypothetical protein
MAALAVDFQRTASTTATLGTMTADATRPRRLKVYDAMFGSEATPADAAILWTFRRCTAAGTSTGVTPTMIDPGDVATEYDAGENHTIEPTYTAGAILLNVPLNQRATFRWVAAPGGELVMPSTASNGFGIETDTISTGTPVSTATVHALEM